MVSPKKLLNKQVLMKLPNGGYPNFLFLNSIPSNNINTSAICNSEVEAH